MEENKGEDKRLGIAELFQTVEEHPEPVAAVVTGEIPSWIRGSLLRVGPGKYEWGDSKYNHWFDGESLIHKFEIEDGGKVQYSNRFLRSTSYLESEKHGRITMCSVATLAPPDPCKNIFQRFFSYFLPPEELTDNCNVNIVNIKGYPVATTEGPAMWRFDPEDLSSVEKLNVEAKLGGMRGWLAHPHEDDNGNYYNFSISMVNGKIDIVKIPVASNENRECLDGIEVIGQFQPYNSKSYYHSFGMTENYFIHVENPLFLSNIVWLFFMRIMNWSFLDLMKEDINKPTVISLIDRKTSKPIQRYIAEHFFVFHHINAYEDGDEVVMDLCGYDDASILYELYLTEIKTESCFRKNSPAGIRRYRLPVDPSSGAENPLILPKGIDGLDYESIFMSLELPRIHYSKFNAKPYKYAYGVAGIERGLAKVNVDTKESYTWSEEGTYPSEPIFVETPDAKEEDDGVVLSMITGLGEKKSFLLILDAKTFEEIARAEVCYKFAPQAHGEFWPK